MLGKEGGGRGEERGRKEEGGGEGEREGGKETGASPSDAAAPVGRTDASSTGAGSTGASSLPSPPSLSAPAASDAMQEEAAEEEGMRKEEEKAGEKAAETAEEEEEEEEEGMHGFTLVEKISRHHFEAQPPPPSSSSLARMVRKEWRLLRSSLPEGILVLGCEARMDLLRAVILGPCKTPYEDGLFVFDIYLGHDYPNSVPAVYFHSYGERLNPNLYDNGKVCLSLLGTWDGDGVEKWNPATSNVLQLLISIQGLVLVPEPYYNEAGYEKQLGTKEGKHNSQQYNEATLLLVLQHMMVTLQAPPAGLHLRVKNHFRSRRDHILKRCQRMLQDLEPAAGAAAGEREGESAQAGAAGGRAEGAKEGEGAGPGAATGAATAGAATAGAATGGGGEAGASGWADRSVAEKGSRGFLRSLQRLQPRLHAALPK